MNKILIAAVLSLSCASAFAGDVYVGASLGSATHKMGYDGYNRDETAGALALSAGYAFNANLAAEAGYVHWGKATASENGASLSSDPGSVYLAGVLRAPLTEQFAVFGKLGVARSSTDVGASYQGVSDSANKKGTSAMFGLGVSYAFTRSVALTVEYSNFGTVAEEDGSSLKLSQVAAGVRFTF